VKKGSNRTNIVKTGKKMERDVNPTERNWQEKPERRCKKKLKLKEEMESEVVVV